MKIRGALILVGPWFWYPVCALVLADSSHKAVHARGLSVKGQDDHHARNRSSGRYRPPDQSSLRRVVLAVHGVYVDDDYVAKFATLEKYRPYFLDMFYIQMREDVSDSEFYSPDGTQQLDLSHKTQRTFDCGDYRFRSKGFDNNSYACMAELMAVVRSRADMLYGSQPDGFLFLHHDFFITPKFLTGKVTDALWWSSGPDDSCLLKVDLVLDVHSSWAHWLISKNETLDAVATYRGKERIDKICKGWSDMYYVPGSVAETWIALARHFGSYGVFLEIAVPTAREILRSAVQTAKISGIVGDCCTDLAPEDLDVEAHEAGHSVDLRLDSFRQRMAGFFRSIKSGPQSKIVPFGSTAPTQSFGS